MLTKTSRPLLLSSVLLSSVLCSFAGAQEAPRVEPFFIETHDTNMEATLLGRDQSIYFSRDGITIAAADRAAGRRDIIKLLFVNSSPKVDVRFERKQNAKINIFTGAREQWNTGKETFRAIVYKNLWPGIDARYSIENGQLKYQFQLAPGADPQNVQIRLRGAAARVNERGELELAAGNFIITDSAPIAWQDGHEGRTAVPVRYHLSQGNAGEQTLTFNMNHYNSSEPLVIDPAILVQSGFFGGNGDDHAASIARDTAGNIYIAGYSHSPETSFPEKAGPDLTYNSTVSADAFIAKFDSTGTQLIYAGYIGGWYSDQATDVAVDAQGRAYVAGTTISAEDEGFPAVVGPSLHYRSGRDGFVARVSADGTALDYCGYVGGSGDYDVINDVKVDGTGAATVVGITNSTQSSFPVAVGPDLTFNGGSYDAFIAKINNTGSSFVYCGYIGGSAAETATALALDSTGRPIIVGYTASTQATFPVSAGPDLTYNGGDYDSFMMKLDTSPNTKLFCGYLGGTGDDEARSVAIDAAGNIIIVGRTDSNSPSFPALNAPDLTNSGGYDGFVTTVAGNGITILRSGFVGGEGDDVCVDVETDIFGNIYITGGTRSHDGIATVDGFDTTYNGGDDGFIVQFAPGMQLRYGTYFGGTGDEQGYGIISDSQGSVFVVGNTSSKKFNIAGALDTTFNGGSTDAFILKSKWIDLPAPSPTATADLIVTKGSMKDVSQAGKDTFSAAGTLTFRAGSDGTFNPASEILNLHFGDGARPFDITIPAGDAGWTAKKGKFTWKSAKGAAPQIAFTIDTIKLKWTLQVSKWTCAAAPENPICIQFEMGNDSAEYTAIWNQKKPGAFTSP